MATVKHSDKFKPSDLVKHNETLRNRQLIWKQCGANVCEHVDTTLNDIKSEPGFYVKDVYRGATEWRGPFNTEQEAKDFHAEMSWERKHS